MTSFRQIRGKRRNALKSTGPKTDAGKRRSRRNAVWHGLTAETVVVALEDIEDYQAFEAAVALDYDARNGHAARAGAAARIAVVAHASCHCHRDRSTSALRRIQGEPADVR
jgi:hypothetical protein